MEYRERVDRAEGIRSGAIYIADCLELLHRDIIEGRKDFEAVKVEISRLQSFAADLSVHVCTDLPRIVES